MHVYIYIHIELLRQKEILTFATSQMDLEAIVISEISLTEKGKYCVFIYMWSLKNK